VGTDNRGATCLAPRLCPTPHLVQLILWLRAAAAVTMALPLAQWMAAQRRAASAADAASHRAASAVSHGGHAGTGPGVHASTVSVDSDDEWVDTEAELGRSSSGGGGGVIALAKRPGDRAVPAAASGAAAPPIWRSKAPPVVTVVVAGSPGGTPAVLLTHQLVFATAHPTGGTAGTSELAGGAASTVEVAMLIHPVRPRGPHRASFHAAAEAAVAAAAEAAAVGVVPLVPARRITSETAADVAAQLMELAWQTADAMHVRDVALAPLRTPSVRARVVVEYATRVASRMAELATVRVSLPAPIPPPQPLRSPPLPPVSPPPSRIRSDVPDLDIGPLAVDGGGGGPVTGASRGGGSGGDSSLSSSQMYSPTAGSDRDGDGDGDDDNEAEEEVRSGLAALAAGRASAGMPAAVVPAPSPPAARAGAVGTPSPAEPAPAIPPATVASIRRHSTASSQPGTPPLMALSASSISAAQFQGLLAALPADELGGSAMDDGRTGSGGSGGGAGGASIELRMSGSALAGSPPPAPSTALQHLGVASAHHHRPSPHLTASAGGGGVSPQLPPLHDRTPLHVRVSRDRAGTAGSHDGVHQPTQGDPRYTPSAVPASAAAVLQLYTGTPSPSLPPAAGSKGTPSPGAGGLVLDGGRALSALAPQSRPDPAAAMAADVVAALGAPAPASSLAVRFGLPFAGIASNDSPAAVDASGGQRRVTPALAASLHPAPQLAAVALSPWLRAALASTAAMTTTTSGGGGGASRLSGGGGGGMMIPFTLLVPSGSRSHSTGGESLGAHTMSSSGGSGGEDAAGTGTGADKTAPTSRVPPHHRLDPYAAIAVALGLRTGLERGAVDHS